jgi:hypothetical protein
MKKKSFYYKNGVFLMSVTRFFCISGYNYNISICKNQSQNQKCVQVFTMIIVGKTNAFGKFASFSRLLDLIFT